MSFITTYTGKHIDPMDPDENDIDILDIAHALSLNCRGNGQTVIFYSVAQHCICCCREAKLRGYPSRLVLACLLHDASEAYLSDVPSPLKKAMDGYREKEDQLIDIIYTKYLGSPLSEEEKTKVKAVDRDFLCYDLKYLLNDLSCEELPELRMNMEYRVEPFEKVEKEYLELFDCCRRGTGI